MATRILKWMFVVLVILAGGGFTAFLYFIPPFTVIAPETFVETTGALPPPLDDITDPATRAIAERGKYLVLTADCGGCHQTPPEPDPVMYLAGGMRLATTTHGMVVSRNLTPDKETGIGGRTDDELKRVLRAGISHDGRPLSSRAMPWPDPSNWSDEDIHAVITYLRHIKAVRHAIPDGASVPEMPPGAIEAFWGGSDAGRR
ncbi:MAG: c-type cytochrome [Acidobacteriota bacterium]